VLSGCLQAAVRLLTCAQSTKVTARCRQHCVSLAQADVYPCAVLVCCDVLCCARRNSDHAAVEAACRRSLAALKLEYLDL
jgi:aryl-alcohol dehydrogenase-like predicted oxidoreductase